MQNSLQSNGLTNINWCNKLLSNQALLIGTVGNWAILAISEKNVVYCYYLVHYEIIIRDYDLTTACFQSAIQEPAGIPSYSLDDSISAVNNL
jgi:hypothetical protein